MTIPGFTAEASLHTLGEPYQGTGVQPHSTPQTRVVPQCCETDCFPFHGIEKCVTHCYPGLCQ